MCGRGNDWGLGETAERREKNVDLYLSKAVSLAV